MKSLEEKRATGNPGQRKLPPIDATVALPGGYVEPHRELGVAGRLFWDRIFNAGGLWLSPQTDVELLLITCKQMDRVMVLEKAFEADPTDFHISRQLLDTEAAILKNLDALGMTVASRTRLGLAEVKRQSKLEELMAKRDKR
jgi:hypothetical protein